MQMITAIQILHSIYDYYFDSYITRSKVGWSRKQNQANLTDCCHPGRRTRNVMNDWVDAAIYGF